MSLPSNLEPRPVLSFFEQICAIPHPSGHTAALADYCAAFAAARGLPCRRDGAGNLLITKPAAPGYEAAPPVILQGHLDMVCQRQPGCPLDPEREGLDLAVEGDWVYARGTTLGADDGVAVAMALAVLDDPALPHPALEVLLTADEEVGMLGAMALDGSWLTGRQLINLDSEVEGEFTVSCAGGCTAVCRLPLTRSPFPGEVLEVSVSGLAGGHSGTEIHRGRANACRALARVLSAVNAAAPMRLISLEGGRRDNAIPAAASARLVTGDAAAALAAAEARGAELAEEFRATDPGLTVSAAPCSPGEVNPMTRADSEKALTLLTCLPGGVQAMSAHIPGLVEASLNLGVVETGPDALTARLCLRSAVDSRKTAMAEEIAALTRALGGGVEIQGDYPGWAYREHSPLRARMEEVYREQYGAKPVIQAIHAGLECGILAGKLPGLDCVSVGPNLPDIHTPRERMSLSSVERVWRFLLEVLRRSR